MESIKPSGTYKFGRWKYFEELLKVKALWGN
jgi:hypothetical protein